jgi:hypothetical protein
MTILLKATTPSNEGHVRHTSSGGEFCHILALPLL